MGRRPTPDIDRFNRFIIINPKTCCWEWQGNLDKDGYGMFYTHSTLKNNRAHRWSYKHHKGKIPDGLQLDHLCRVKNCVNPTHLEPVTNQINNRRRADLITSCPYGHPYDEENTYHHSGMRGCKICRRKMALDQKKKIKISEDK